MLLAWAALLMPVASQRGHARRMSTALTPSVDVGDDLEQSNGSTSRGVTCTCRCVSACSDWLCSCSPTQPREFSQQQEAGDERHADPSSTARVLAVPGALRDRASHAQTISALPSMRSPDATGPKWLECVGTDGRRSAQTGRLEPARSCPTDRTKHLWGRIAVGRTVPLPTSGRWASEEKRACRVAGLGARLDSHKGDGLRPAAPVHPSGRGHVQGPNVGRAPHTVAPATAGRAAGSRAASRSRRD